MCTLLRGRGTGLSHPIRLLPVENEELPSMSRSELGGISRTPGKCVGERAELRDWTWFCAEGPNREGCRG